LVDANAGAGEGEEGNANNKKAVPSSSTDKQEVPAVEAAVTGDEPEQSESDDSMEQDS
jgi:hypothetical protein